MWMKAARYLPSGRDGWEERRGMTFGTGTGLVVGGGVGGRRESGWSGAGRCFGSRARRSARGRRGWRSARRGEQGLKPCGRSTGELARPLPSQDQVVRRSARKSVRAVERRRAGVAVETQARARDCLRQGEGKERGGSREAAARERDSGRAQAVGTCRMPLSVQGRAEARLDQRIYDGRTFLQKRRSRRSPAGKRYT